MAKYLMILAALFALVACGGDDPIGGGWTTYAGLEWSPRPKMTWMTWVEAMDYCEALDARLPTIDELRKIIINCFASTYGGPCQVSDPDCLGGDCVEIEDCRCDGSAESYSALGDGKNVFLWSSSSYVWADWAWMVGFDNASLLVKYNNNDAYNVRCVR